MIRSRLSPSTRREMGRFVISGVVGSIIGFLSYKLIWFLLPPLPAKATVAWVIGFHIAVLRQHWLHSRYTFPGMRQHFWRNFGRVYVAYLLGLVFSTVCHYLVSETLALGGNIGWLAGYAVGFVINFPLLKRMVYRQVSTPEQVEQPPAST